MGRRGRGKDTERGEGEGRRERERDVCMWESAVRWLEELVIVTLTYTNVQCNI